MPKRFKEVKVGESFRLVENPITYYGKPVTLVKIPVLKNYQTTTGYIRNAKLKEMGNMALEKYYYIDDETLVEVIDQ